MFCNGLLQWLAGTRLARLAANSILRHRARGRLAGFDQKDPAATQAQVLRGLVHRAHATRFGRDHDFARIRTPADFRRLVPLRPLDELWKQYWQPGYPALASTTWPGPIPGLIRLDPPSNGACPCVPFSAALLEAHRSAAWTALGLVVTARRNARPFSGRLLVVQNEASDSDPLGGHDMQSLALAHIPHAWRSYIQPTSAAQAEEPTTPNDGKPPVTGIAGRADTVIRYFEHVCAWTGGCPVSRVWPRLTAVVFRRVLGTPDRDVLQRLIDDARVLLVEAWSRPEGTLAVEDPRFGALRLLTDHGLYFEFVPIDELGHDRPIRLGVAEVQRGVPYAVALSSPAGLWACLLGDVVTFERTDPLLLRVLEPIREKAEPRPGTVAPHFAMPTSRERPIAEPARPFLSCAMPAAVETSSRSYPISALAASRLR